MSDRVLKELNDEGVLTLTFNRPALKNSFDAYMWKAATDALNEAREDGRVAVVVVTGAGGGFSAGVDLSSMAGGGPPADAPEGVEIPEGFNGLQDFMDALTTLDKPLVAAVEGFGVGIGATMLFHCDFVYMGESARLRMPFASLALVPEGYSTYMLKELVGTRVASEMLLTSQWVSAERALDTGIATAVVPDSKTLEAAIVQANEIGQFSIASLKAIKGTILAHRQAGFEIAKKVENEGLAAMVGTPENREAAMAFMERRPADFKQFRKA